MEQLESLLASAKSPFEIDTTVIPNLKAALNLASSIDLQCEAVSLSFSFIAAMFVPLVFFYLHSFSPSFLAQERSGRKLLRAMDARSSLQTVLIEIGKDAAADEASLARLKTAVAKTLEDNSLPEDDSTVCVCFHFYLSSRLFIFIFFSFSVFIFIFTC